MSGGVVVLRGWRSLGWREGGGGRVKGLLIVQGRWVLDRAVGTEGIE